MTKTPRCPAGPWALWKPTLDALLEGRLEPRSPARRKRTQPTQDGLRLAVVELNGILTKDPDPLGELPAGTRGVREEIRAAAESDNVDAVLLRIDSPGGEVRGTMDLADEVFRARAEKPVLAYVEDLGASAAYWVASRATKVMANPAALVGSLGVYHSAVDFSAAFEGLGIKTTVVGSGPFKGIETPGAPITDEHLAEAQRIVDAMAALFLQSVADGRGLTLEQVRERAGDGRVHPAAEAKRLGLIDEVGDLELALSELSKLAKVRNPERKTGPAAKSGHPADYHELTTMLPAEALADEVFMELWNADATIDEILAEWKLYSRRHSQTPTPEKETVMERTQTAAAEWQEALAAKLKAGMNHQAAVAALVRERPELHAEYVEEHNRQYRRRR